MPTLLNRLPFTSAFWRRPPPRVEMPRAAQAVAPPMASPRELEEIRGAAMRRMFPKLFGWCADRWDRGMAVEIHNYLAGATSVGDLEQRIRHIERRRHFSS
jgi:hypothetical protein